LTQQLPNNLAGPALGLGTGPKPSRTCEGQRLSDHQGLYAQSN